MAIDAAQIQKSLHSGPLQPLVVPGPVELVRLVRPKPDHHLDW